MKQTLFILTLFLCFSSVWANTETTDRIIKGKIIDSKTKKPLEYVSVAIYKAKTGKLVTGTITKSDGHFNIPNLSKGVFNVELSFMGYKTKKIMKVNLLTHKNTNIGIQTLIETTKHIDEVSVVAERAAINYKIDKKIVNVSKQYTAVSGSAVDVLKNVPSMTVDIEGNVSMRGSSSFMVLIDGVPSVLEPSEALQQIPSSSIENIEIITNPSAKYSAEGTAGIINIITKKNKLQGINGVVSANAGDGRYGGNFLLNYRKGKVGYFIGGDYDKKHYYGDKDLSRTSNKGMHHLINNGDFDLDLKRANIRGGFDYRMDTMNIFNFDFNVGNRDYDNSTKLHYKEWNDNNNSATKEYISKDDGSRGGNMYSTSATYLHKFSNDGHEVKVMASYRSADKDESSYNQLYNVSGVKQSGKKNTENGPMHRFQTDIDYSLPISDKAKFEAGYQLKMSSSTNKTALYNYNPNNGDYEEDPPFTNKTSFTNNVHSIYTTYSDMLGKFGYQLGLRSEYTDREIKLKHSGGTPNTTSPDKSEINRLDWFPTVHLSYKLPQNQEIMTSYTRRIHRSRSYYLEPFITWIDAYNVRKGSPSLLPEYIDSYEMAYLKKWDKAFINLEAYYRMTHNKVEWVKSVYSSADNVMMTSPENVGKDYSLGIDATFSLDIFKWWRADLSSSMYNYKVTGQLTGRDFSREDFTWNSRLNNTFKLNKTTQIQLFTRYNSKNVTAQGYRKSSYSTDLAIRKEMFNRKFTGVLQVRDVFNQNRKEDVSEGPDFSEYSRLTYGGPFVNLTLTYRFNNYKASKKRSIGSGDDFGGEEGGY